MTGLDITRIDALEILDCRGEPTVQVELEVADEIVVRADVPAGRSTGANEATELRDGENRYGGKGVREAVKSVIEEIGPRVVGMDVTRQRDIDRAMIELDGTIDKSRLGANAVVGVSLAAARGAATALDLPLYRYINVNAHVLPVPLVNLINGGRHASNDLDFQEFCIFPVGAETFAEAMEIAFVVNSVLREIIVRHYGKIAANVGDEGGFAPPIVSVREAMDRLAEAVQRSGFADKIVFGLDCAATHLFDRASRTYGLEGRRLAADRLLEFYKGLIKSYPIATIEDPFAEDDVEGFVAATRELGIQVVGDDFFCTDPARLRQRLPLGAANALLWKVNQIGTLSEAMDAADIALRSRCGVMVSERSGETEDAIIADLVVGLNAGQIKTGAPVRGERTAKYNRLLRIERELGPAARYAGRDYRVR
ncbi:MAG: phosphopyruvate hydratase [Proteobacteria bacterium]|nr:phosphopyruvate hydratase [Pseudomonadota bacterium]